MKKHMGCPGWLRLTDDRTEFIFIPERAAIVKRIFEMSASGLGGYTIAKKLNASGVPGLGSSGRWDQSTIHNMLRSRATLGEYQKKRKVNGKEMPFGKPVLGYYPAVIDEVLFQAAQQARVENRASGRGRKGNDIANLFDGMANCVYCKGPVRFHSNGNAKSLVCSSVLEREGCHRYRWTYRDFELSFLAVARDSADSKLVELIENLKAASEAEKYERRIELMLYFRETVSGLRVAMAGSQPPMNSPPAPIARDNPKRFFEVTFGDSSPVTGVPLPTPSADTGIRLDEGLLSKALNLSPRQSALVASLVTGRSLAQTAEHLEMALSTARWHLRTIFERTKTHSQDDLTDLACTTFERLKPRKNESFSH